MESGPSTPARITSRLKRLKSVRTRVIGKIGGKPATPSQYVFIVSGGRSGSTLLQGLLNALPRTLVRGENSFYVLPMFRAYRGARKFQRQFGKSGGEPSSAFYGLGDVDVEDFVRSTRDLTMRALLGAADPSAYDRIGFKEVRWEDIRPGETEGFFEFFEKMFPNAKYVLNERDPKVVVGSGQWLRTDEESALKALARVRDVQQYLRETRPGRTYDTTFEIITGDDHAVRDAQLKGLAEFVTGSCTEAVLDRMRKVLSIGHGPYPFGGARRDRKTASK